MKKRNRILFGYFLMLLGIAIPLYGFASICINDMRANAGYESFKANFKETSKELSDKIRSYNDALSDSELALVDPFDAEEYKVKYEINKDDPQMIFSYLRIPSLNLVQPIRLGASYDNLALGAAHIDGTSLPVGGDSTRSVIAGHRGWYRDFMFLNLGELSAGDDVFIEGADYSLHYRVVGSEVIEPYEWEKLSPHAGKDMLTLLTCEPLAPPRNFRLLVNCERVEEVRDVSEVADEGGVVETTEVEVCSGVKLFSRLTYAATAFCLIMIVVVMWKLYGFLRRNK